MLLTFVSSALLIYFVFTMMVWYDLFISLLDNDESPPEQKRSTSASGSSQDAKKSNSSNIFLHLHYDSISRLLVYSWIILHYRPRTVREPTALGISFLLGAPCTSFAWLTLTRCRNEKLFASRNWLHLEFLWNCFCFLKQKAFRLFSYKLISILSSELCVNYSLPICLATS